MARSFSRMGVPSRNLIERMSPGFHPVPPFSIRLSGTSGCQRETLPKFLSRAHTASTGASMTVLDDTYVGEAPLATVMQSSIPLAVRDRWDQSLDLSTAI